MVTARDTCTMTTTGDRFRPAMPLASVLGGVMKLAELVSTPVLPSEYLDLVDPLRSGTDLRGRIVRVDQETRESVSLTIQPGRGWERYTPGQYVRVGVDVDGVRQWRAYSITSRLDRSDGCIGITVKAIPGGKVSNFLNHRARLGATIQLDQAQGDFVLPDALPGKLLFVTAGSGITPVMGILRNNIDELDDVVLVHSAPRATDVIFGVELADLAERGRIRLIERHTDTFGMLDPAEIAEMVPDFASRQTWACGPTGMLDALESFWEQSEIADRMHTERFRPTVSVVGEGGFVHFTESNVSLEVDGTRPLLDDGEGAGVLMPSGCRMGICRGCMVPLRQGAVLDLRSGEVTEAAPGDGVVIQTCISAPVGHCEVEL
jgi:ferredoxin-NADP reductase